MRGYNLFLTGITDDEERDFAITISEKQQEKYKFHIGDEIKGTGWTKKYPEWEYADYYRTGALKKLQENNVVPIKDDSPWLSEVPELSVYDWRGCRMLDKKCWSGKCFRCKWACMANVTIEYNWGVTQKYRFESFCYRKSLQLAKENGIKSISFPLISTGGFGYPKEEGMRIAVLSSMLKDTSFPSCFRLYFLPL